jgi:2-dehydro-3-deoxygluconokinase
MRLDAHEVTRLHTHQKVWYYHAGSAGSAGSKLCAANLPVSLISRARLQHLTGVTPALSKQAAGAVDAAIAMAHATGVADLSVLRFGQPGGSEK